MADETRERQAPRSESAARRRPAQRDRAAPRKEAPRNEAPHDSTPSKESAPPTESSSRADEAQRTSPAQRGWQVALEAARQLQQLTGNEVEGITGLDRTDDGWRVQVDVLELRRVPTTTDVIATYDVDVDRDGELVGYRRRHRFVRGEVGDER